ncbi:hypothetical protein D3C71_1103550 [compost metagenome]
MEVEDLHLLGGFHAGPDLAQVVQLAALGRPLEVERVTGRVEMRFADEGRHQRHCQQQDQPGRVHQQAHRQAGHGDGVLHLAEQLAHQVHPAHGLAPRAVQLVLQVRIFEVLQVQLGGVFHQPHAGDVGEQLGEQAVGIVHRAAQQVRDDRQAELEGQQAQQGIEQAAGEGLAKRREAGLVLAQVQCRIDDQLAHVEHGHRQQCADQAQPEAGTGQGGAGLPDLAQEGGQVAHRLEAFAQAGVLLAGRTGSGGSRHGRHCARRDRGWCMNSAHAHSADAYAPQHGRAGAPQPGSAGRWPAPGCIQHRAEPASGRHYPTFTAAAATSPRPAGSRH